jgi:hypothetical protein
VVDKLITVMDWIRDPDNLTAVSTFVIAIFTIVLAVIGYVQARLIRKSIDLARAEFISSHRPRLILREVQRLLPTGAQRNIELRYVVANIGSSEAEIVESHIELQDIRDGGQQND